MRFNFSIEKSDMKFSHVECRFGNLNGFFHCQYDMNIVDMFKKTFQFTEFVGDYVMFCHQQAFARQSQLLANLRARVNGFMAIEVPATQVSVSDAVSTYLFNSQLLSRDDGSMMLVLPQECREHAGVWGYLNELLAADNPISELKVFDLRESMANGGGPACLRLRVVLTEEERRAVNPAVMMNDTLFNALNDWVDRYYRDRLTAADLADPQLLREGREALDVLSQLLNLGSVYPFQREGGGNG